MLLRKHNYIVATSDIAAVGTIEDFDTQFPEAVLSPFSVTVGTKSTQPKTLAQIATCRSHIFVGTFSDGTTKVILDT